MRNNVTNYIMRPMLGYTIVQKLAISVTLLTLDFSVQYCI